METRFFDSIDFTAEMDSAPDFSCDFTATVHGIQQIRSRRNYKTFRDAESNIHRALLKGKSAADFTGFEKIYLANLGRDGCRAIVYDQYIYIVSPCNTCVTGYPVPEWFGRRGRLMGKQTLPAYKQNCRNNDYLEEAREYLRQIPA